MSLERIYFETEDFIELAGLLSKPIDYTDEIVISIHGMQSNCMKRREDILGKEISNKGLAYFAFNNRGHELMSYAKRTNYEKSPMGGAAFEDVLDGYYDIKAAINKMIELGFKKIHLQGHSLGCTKIVYTYNRLIEEKNERLLSHIKSVILLSLVDIVGLQITELGEKHSEALEYALNKEKEGKTFEFMPFGYFIHPISVKTYLRYNKYKDKIDFARFGDENYDFKELNNIKVPLFLRWGTVFEEVSQDLDYLVKMLKSKINNEKLNIGYIEGADHGYFNKEEVLAKEIINFIEAI